MNARPAWDHVARRLLLAILWLGLVGTEVELLLLKHTDGLWQVLPIALIGVAVLTLAVHALAPSPATVRGIQVVMLAFLASGVLGIVLHFEGNAEFELERIASLTGLELFKAAVMGATPTLAPGTMVQLGLVGLLYTYQHPATGTRDAEGGTGRTQGDHS